ncbi:hypothetical protein GKZ90_0011795 [Flavobacterium sp. MC2016-06]|uniref:hypothetical protein n=1 Tax=Flavobacterium sp. MC2016-06 TaxID=2676308 RepID=UPI0012BB0B9D|nr:hypothetical protein [Flavobacterium sp. MC2016-06]MBU3862131.1 hypothetical protein [Flavobacterium sp. MC2016-06]
MKLNKLLLLLLLTNVCFGQFQTTGKLKEVSQNGFHEIRLSPEIRAASKQDLSDIRIFNSKGNEIPYFIQNSTNISSDSFEEYTIISKKAEQKKYTSLIIAVPSAKNNKQLSLFIANSDVIKKYSISGSDDQKEWFGISDSQSLSDLNSTTESSVVKTITYPLSTYKYLKIDFDDKKTLPINVLKVGNFTTNVQTQSFEEVTPKQLSTTEIPSKKETQIHILFDAPQIINQIVFEVLKPTYYNRQVVLYKKVKREVKRKSQIYDEEIASFELNSNVKNSFTIPEIFEKEIFIRIENQDNLPLTISSIKFNQKPISIIADLNANENYILKTGNTNAVQPEYDLSNFKNNIIGALPQSSIYGIQHKSEVKKDNDNKSFWQQSWFMWLCIILGGITILYFTASLVKDLKKQN